MVGSPFTKDYVQKNLLSFWNQERTLESLTVLVIIGLFYSTFLTTVSLSGIAILSLRGFSFDNAEDFIKDRRMFPFVLVFLVVLVSGFQTENQEAWLTALRVKLPFLILPFAIFLLPPIQEKLVLQLHFWLLGITVVVGFPVLFYALTHYNEMLELISQGQAIPTPIEHVKYSMINAYAAISSGIILALNYNKYGTIDKWSIGMGMLFLIFLLHVLAVRTGLLIFYCSVIVLFAYFLYKFRSLKRSIAMALVIILLPILAYQNIPSIQHKVGYMMYDWHQYRIDGVSHYSDSERRLTAIAAWNIWKNEPILGVGYGDVKDEIDKYIFNNYNRSGTDKLPHSQFLLTLSGSGLIGLLLFLIGFYMPLWKSGSNGIIRLLLVFLYLNYSLSFLVENSLERSVSVAFFVLLALLLIKSNDVKTIPNSI